MCISSHTDIPLRHTSKPQHQKEASTLALDQRFMRFLVTQAGGKIKSALEHAAGSGAEPSLREAQTHITELAQAIDDHFASGGEPSGKGRGKRAANE